MRNQSAASVKETCDAIDAACRGSGYSCKSVSWDDVQRSTVGGAGLSCWGANITDTRLYEQKTGALLYTCRPENWNEKLGCVSARDIAVVVGNHENENGRAFGLQPISLAKFLRHAGTYGSYVGLDSATNLYNDALDKQVSVRFQTTFLPVDESDCTEFCTEAYNYNTLSDSDPRNAIVLCTTQGIAFQQDGVGAKRLYHHSVDAYGAVHSHWLEAERSRHVVGGAQVESKQEATEAAARGKATASVIGIEAMGTRFNALMTVQIPLRQNNQPRNRGFGFGCGNYTLGHAGTTPSFPEEKPSFCFSQPLSNVFGSSVSTPQPCDPHPGMWSSMLGRATRNRARIGESNAARVSRGSEVLLKPNKIVHNKFIERDPSQHVTVTIVLYNTVAGGVPSANDVRTAVEDMEMLYGATSWSGKLGDNGADFMKRELSAAESQTIVDKISNQPYKAPKCRLVENHNMFPRTNSPL